jgi:hypothetical protein
MHLPFDKETLREITVQAELEGVSMEDFVHNVVVEHLNDIRDTAIADERMADILSGDVEPVPAEEVYKRLGLED